jgi:hypothetical protein
MAIKYYLQPNPLTHNPAERKARIQTGEKHDLDSIIEIMLNAGTTVGKPDVLAVLSLFFSTVSHEVAEGNSVNLPLVRIRAGITGVFEDETDHFDQNRHRLKVNFSGGKLLNDAISDVKLHKIDKYAAGPMVIQFTDIQSGTINSSLTPGGIGQLNGSELKFNRTSEHEGIFFIHSNGEETKVQTLAHHTRNKLVFVVPPSLPPGNYTVEVRKQYGSANLFIRRGRLHKALIAI